VTSRALALDRDPETLNLGVWMDTSPKLLPLPELPSWTFRFYQSRAVMERAHQRRPAPRLTVGASPHFSPQQLPLAGARCQPLCLSLGDSVEEVRWSRLPFHKRAPLLSFLLDQGMSCQWAMAWHGAPQNASQERAGKCFWLFTRIGNVSPPHLQPTLGRPLRGPSLGSYRAVVRRDSIAHRRREVQGPS
jgi:hypothetical protein